MECSILFLPLRVVAMEPKQTEVMSIGYFICKASKTLVLIFMIDFFKNYYYYLTSLEIEGNFSFEVKW